MEANLLDRMLETYQQDRTVLTITLQNKVRLTGTIKAFDSYVIMLGGEDRDIIFRHAVSSVMPGVKAEPKPVSRTKQPERPARAEQPPSERNSARPVRGADRVRKPAPQPQRPAAASPDTCINTGMKDGLLKWMQERKASGK